MATLKNNDGNETSDNCYVDDLDLEKVYRTTASFLCSAGVPPQSKCAFDFMDIVHHMNPYIRLKPHMFEPLYFQIYEDYKARTKEMLRDYDGKITLSIDILDYEYMCVTAHYVDDDWKKRNWVLFYRSVCVPGDPGLNESLLKCIAEFEIETKIFAITTNTRPDFSLAFFKIVKDAIQQKKKLALDGQLFRVICCADVFSSMVRKAFKKMNDIMDTLHELYSPGRSEPVWNVTLGYLEDVLKLEARGEYNPDNEDLVGYEVPSSTEWEKARGVFKLVNTIYKAAYVMFETKHATANVYLHLLLEVQETLTRESTSPDKFVAELATIMVKRVNDYCKAMFTVLAVTTVMDPRFKMKYIEFSDSNYAGISTSEGCNKAAGVLEAIRKLYEDYVIENPVEEESAESDSSSCDMEGEEDSEEDDDSEKEYFRKEEEKCQEKCREYYNEFSLFNKYCLLAGTTTHPVKSELDCYLEEPVLAWKQDFNVISWWKASSSKYPTLSKMARDILAIQMTVATSYDNYYTQPRPVEARLKSTRPELMNAIMCAKSWMRAGPLHEN